MQMRRARFRRPTAGLHLLTRPRRLKGGGPTGETESVNLGAFLRLGRLAGRPAGSVNAMMEAEWA